MTKANAIKNGQVNKWQEYKKYGQIKEYNEQKQTTNQKCL